MPSSADASRGLDGRERALTLGVILLTATAPIAVGGVHPMTQVVLTAGALALLTAYAAMRGVRGLRVVPFAGAAALAVGFTLLQLVPLPSALVAFVSPAAWAVRSDVASARLMPLTVDAPATWLALARGVACLALLLAVGGFVRSRRHARMLLGGVAATAALVALIAIVQRVAGARQILGFYTPRGTPGFGFYGTFVDVNHAASLLALGALVGVGVAVESSGPLRIVFGSCSALATAALLFSSSRAGFAGFAVGGFLLAVLLSARSVGYARALVVATVLLLVAVPVTLWTHEGLRARFAANPQQIVDNQKTRGWAAGMAMASAYRWTGVGRGAFASPIASYRHDDEGVRLVYPENIVVQMASEWGLPLTLALLAMVLATSRRLSRFIGRASPAVVAGGCAVTAVLVHELADFGLEMPGVAFPTVVTVAVVASRLAHEDGARRRRRVPPRTVAPLLAAGALVVVGAGWASDRTLDEDWARLAAGVQARASVDGELRRAIARHPADDFLELLAAQDALRKGSAEAMHHLNRALVLHPTNWQAHRLAARLLATLKRPAQAALEYRLAIESGMTPDLSEMARVLGDHVVAAVPQTPARLVDLARQLYAIGRVREADAAAVRAVDVSDARPAQLMTRLRLALDVDARPVLAPAARALLAENDAVDAFALAARAFARAGAQADSDAAIDAGLRAHRADATLLLTGAELRLDAGDVAGARTLLGRAGRTAALTLPERQRAEELLAKAAERAGDVEAAAVARARARLIARQLQDMTFIKTP